MSQYWKGHAYTKRICIVYLKFKLRRVSCILPGDSTLDHNQKQYFLTS